MDIHKSIVLWMLTFGICIYLAETTLSTTFVGGRNGSSSIYLRTRPTGILMSEKPVTALSFDYQISLIPNSLNSVVLSIYSYDIKPNCQLIIEDSDHFKIALIGTNVFKDEKKSFISKGKMSIRYKTTPDESDLWHIFPTCSFQFTFTSVSEKPCSSNEFECGNGKCILEEFLCDGHNHCGDNSDQKNCVPKSRQDQRVKYRTSGAETIWITTIAICSVILLVVIIVFVVAFVRHSKLKKAANTEQNTISRSAGGNIPLESVSASVLHSHPEANVTQPTALGAELPKPSVYDRIRTSLRRTRADGSPIPNERTVPFQVPSMYPSLDVLASAPEMDGNENPSFKNDQEEH